MSSNNPTIILGAGHNGLTAAAYLAKHGLKPLVLESRDVLGGIAATETLLPGFNFNTGFASTARVREAVVRELDLVSLGYTTSQATTALTAVSPDGPISLGADGELLRGRRLLSDGGVSADLKDFALEIKRIGGILSRLGDLTLPNIKGPHSTRQLLQLAGLGMQVRGQGGRRMVELMRSLPMSARELLERRLTDERLKGALCIFSSVAANQGPFGAGSALNLLNQLSGGISPVFCRGGAGGLSKALQAAVERYGGEVRTGTTVKRILVEDGRAVGVITEGGENISAASVVSSLDPGTTLLKLLQPGLLPVRFTRRLNAIRFQGSTATVHFALDRIPDFGTDPSHLDGWIVYCPSIEYLERAYDDAKYGLVSAKPALLGAIPSIRDPDLTVRGKHTLSVMVRYAPYGLKTEAYERLPETVLDLLSQCAPDFREAVQDHHMLTPVDYESIYGLTEGAWSHGQMGMDQQLIMRPVPGWSDYRTPIKALWLCGSGTHPGGGITCAPGRNAAREIVKGG